jgi:hypothetical protein
VPFSILVTGRARRFRGTLVLLVGVKVRAVTLSGRAPRMVVAVAEKIGKGWLGQAVGSGEGVRGHPGAGSRGLTVAVAVPRAEIGPG